MYTHFPLPLHIGQTHAPVSFTVYHRTKIEEAEFNLLDLEDPDVFLYNPTNQLVFSNYTYLSSGRQIFTNVVTDRLPTQEVALAVYTSRVWVTSLRQTPESDFEPQSAQRQQRVRAGLLASPSLRSLWPLWLPQHRFWGLTYSPFTLLTSLFS